jgi:diguanylate cyclase (GGDEF)-like protein
MALEVSKILKGREQSTDRGAVLVQVYPPGPNLGRRFALAGPEHFCGRLQELDVSIDDEGISRRHAKLSLTDDGWGVEDLGSTNGVYVNDKRVARKQLRDGDLLRLGGAILKFLSGSNVEAAYHEEIYRMSIMDALTGVHNKRYFLEFLEREMARSVRYGTPLSLVMFDIDHFKKVNDTHGHLAGDAVLREIGNRMRPRMRREDLLARYGGEEFAAVLANTGTMSARKFAEEIRQLVAREPFATEQQMLEVTISLGLAELDASIHTGEELISRADQNLYAAKRGGRNRVVG